MLESQGRSLQWRAGFSRFRNRVGSVLATPSVTDGMLAMGVCVTYDSHALVDEGAENRLRARARNAALAEETARRQNSGEMCRSIRNRGEVVMTQATIAPPDIKTLADLRRRLGGISLERIWFHPAPGTATEKDVITAEERENRLCELVDGTLVEKAMGFEESRVAIRALTSGQALISISMTWESALEPTA